MSTCKVNTQKKKKKKIPLDLASFAGALSAENLSEARQVVFFSIGDRERIRTAGLPLRRRSLYPAELHNQVLKTERDYIIIPEDYKGRSPRA